MKKLLVVLLLFVSLCSCRSAPGVSAAEISQNEAQTWGEWDEIEEELHEIAKEFVSQVKNSPYTQLDPEQILQTKTGLICYVSYADKSGIFSINVFLTWPGRIPEYTIPEERQRSIKSEAFLKFATLYGMSDLQTGTRHWTISWECT